jgi:hypothetical protein
MGRYPPNTRQGQAGKLDHGRPGIDRPRPTTSSRSRAAHRTPTPGAPGTPEPGALEPRRPPGIEPGSVRHPIIGQNDAGTGTRKKTLDNLERIPLESAQSRNRQPPATSSSTKGAQMSTGVAVMRRTITQRRPASAGRRKAAEANREKMARQAARLAKYAGAYAGGEDGRNV